MLETWLYMFKDTPVAKIDFDIAIRYVSVVNYTNCLMDMPFGLVENPCFDDFEWFIMDRCVPKTRCRVYRYLHSIDLQDYDVYDIIRKTHGADTRDYYWLKFEDESGVCFNDVRLRD